MMIFNTKEEAEAFVKEMITWENANPTITYQVIFEDVHGWCVEYNGREGR